MKNKSLEITKEKQKLLSRIKRMGGQITGSRAGGNRG